MERGVGIVGLELREGAEGDPPSRAPLTSPDLAGVGLAWSSLRERTWPYGSPQPSEQTSKRGPETRLQARRGGARGSGLGGGRGSPPSKVLHQPPHVQSEGGRKSLQSPGLRLYPRPPGLRPSRRASPRPVLGAAAATEPSSAARGRVEPSSRPRRVAGLSAVRGRGRGRR